MSLHCPQKEGVGQAHAFRSKSFKKPRPCHWCHQPVHNTGSCCRGMSSQYIDTTCVGTVTLFDFWVTMLVGWVG